MMHVRARSERLRDYVRYGPGDRTARGTSGRRSPVPSELGGSNAATRTLRGGPVGRRHPHVGDRGPSLSVTMPDARCSMVNLDPDSARSAPEVLKAVAGRAGDGW